MLLVKFVLYFKLIEMMLGIVLSLGFIAFVAVASMIASRDKLNKK